jgi:hypothetical protein
MGGCYLVKGCTPAETPWFRHFGIRGVSRFFWQLGPGTTILIAFRKIENFVNVGLSEEGTAGPGHVVHVKITQLRGCSDLRKSCDSLEGASSSVRRALPNFAEDGAGDHDF